MYEELFSKTSAQFETWAAPARKFNNLLVDHLAKVSDYQMEAAKAYTDLSVEQLRAMTKISDAKDLQDFVSNQTKVIKTMSEKLGQDANTLAGFGKDLTAELQKLAQENVAAANKTAKAA